MNEWHGIALNYNYEADGVNGVVHACRLTNGFVTGFRWFHEKKNKIPFRMKLENFDKIYHISNHQ
jgi:hypothetical protein